ncbi:MAG: hypothetical protein ACRDC4_12475 [Plesiomonas sp.]
MSHIEMEWVEAAREVSHIKARIENCKRKRKVFRLIKKALEQELRELKVRMSSAMRAGDYAKVSRHHKDINLLRAQLKQECGAIKGKSHAIASLVKQLASVEKRRDEFAEAYHLIKETKRINKAISDAMDEGILDKDGNLNKETQNELAEAFGQ